MEKSKRFSGKKYVTIGITENIPIEIQNRIYCMIHNVCESLNEVDYLQVFELTSKSTDEGTFQVISHSQDVPEYSSVIKLKITKPITEKKYM